jgi:hypothetical protein
VHVLVKLLQLCNLFEMGDIMFMSNISSYGKYLTKHKENN